MCSIGVCGCIAGATAHVTAAWHETVPQPETEAGFPVQPPRPGSQLAALGIPGGARVLTVDGEEVAATHPYDVQAAIRKHQAAEPIRLRIQTGKDVQEVAVTRADHESA
jgi:S1-C subfamily serine protease